MKVIPVLDLRGGVVVRGVGGRRDAYQPIQSSLTTNSAPATILDALIDRFGFRSAYVADLDAIMTGQPDIRTLAELAERPIEMTVDAGLRSVKDAERLFDLGVACLVAASETLASEWVLSELLARFPVERLVFSMDMKSGRSFAEAKEWRDLSPAEIVDRAAALGATRHLLLDLADVGMGGGPQTLSLLSCLRKSHPAEWFAVGGGVCSLDDLRAAERAGANAVLVASALHDGRLTPGDLQDFLA